MKNKEELLRNIYTAYLRKTKGNQWIQISNKDKELFDDLAKTLELKEMDFHDYVDYHFNHVKYMSPKYICSPIAIDRYDYHRKLKNRYTNDDYAIDGENFYVNSTRKMYSMDQVKDPVAEDPEANFALVMSEQENCQITRKLYEAVEYAICKFRFKSKLIPTSLSKLSEAIHAQDIKTNSK